MIENPGPPHPAATAAVTSAATAAVTYAAAGVDIAAGERAVELMGQAVRRTQRPEVVGGLGGFASLFALDLTRWRRPLLACSTDGVGTKLAIARELGVHDTIGIDLVAMIVDDLVVCGAEPLFLQDYIACGRVVPERIAEIVAGIAEGCVQAGCALVGGETAEHAGLMAADDYDLSGTGLGVVDADAVLGKELVRPGDVLLALGSSGLHSNGFTLVRRVLLEMSRLSLDAVLPDLGNQVTLGTELLTPTRIYAQDCLALVAGATPHAFAHITGGGIAGNLARVLPANVDAVVDRSTWTPAPIFELVATLGPVARPELERTLNVGVGMVAALDPDRVDRALAVLRERGTPAWVMGEVTHGTGSVRMTGRHPS
ncbi:MAG: phosphoribosylformylglycinamidine cyclo-ligase [Actinobacteria bacterium]|nr:phosphoribosylformylglycinamidine cyclo-ligase [Actinomycetota bacterium]MBI3686440.1 phosphoribosylformylglycinamidine cyclo-ligase [Actinomycetota bacterium]